MRDDSAGPVLGFDHIQVAIPAGPEAEARARRFYGEVLGLAELPKPAALAGRGGAWFACGALALHVGVDPAFRPAQKAHPALLVRDLDAARARLEAAGLAIREDVPLPGYRRLETRDPFGNRLELMQRLAEGAAAGTGAGTEPTADDAKAAAIKERVRAQFGSTAEAYVASRGHAEGRDLARLVELAAPRASDLALDVSTGGGHTALALAPHVARVVASDLTPAMLEAARRFLTARGVTNADYVIADAERLPFLAESFDVVTVRIAPHHYADARVAAREMARVLRSGGRLVVVDNVAPADPQLDAFVNDIERRRDPSHVRCYTEAEWRAMLAEAGLDVGEAGYERKTHDFADWTARARMPEGERDALERDMLAAPATARERFAVVERDGHVASWRSEVLILRAVKE